MIFQNCPKYHEPRSGEWYLENFEILCAGIIAKYYVQVMLSFVYNRSRESFGNAQETFLQLQKKNTGVDFIPSIFAVIQLLRGNSDAINQSNLRNFSAYIIKNKVIPATSARFAR